MDNNIICRIEEMEKILNSQIKVVDDLNRAIDYMEKNRKDYSKLIDYYYSEERSYHLDQDDNGNIDKNLRRGVLSEDEIFNLMTVYYDTAFRMLETATKMLKRG